MNPLPAPTRPSAPPLFPAERISRAVASGPQGHPFSPQPGLGGGLHLRNLQLSIPSGSVRAPGPQAQAECAKIALRSRLYIEVTVLFIVDLGGVGAAALILIV